MSVHGVDYYVKTLKNTTSWVDIALKATCSSLLYRALITS